MRFFRYSGAGALMACAMLSFLPPRSAVAAVDYGHVRDVCIIFEPETVPAFVPKVETPARYRVSNTARCRRHYYAVPSVIGANILYRSNC